MSNITRIALISDIHGNMPALKATLQDIKRRDIHKIFCLGDLAGKGPQGDKAVDICREECEVIIKGNWDDFITNETDKAVFQWHQRRLGQERLEFLKQLPHTLDFYLSGKRVRLFHASQISVHYRVRMTDPEEKHLAMFTNTEFTGNGFEPNVVGYGDIHRAYLLNYKNKMLFNVGSVGNPLDITQASYALLEGKYNSKTDDTFSINLIRVPYDIELAIKQAEAEDMPELDFYAMELRTAVYRGVALRS